MLTAALADAGILSCRYATCMIGDLRIAVIINEVQTGLTAASAGACALCTGGPFRAIYPPRLTSGYYAVKILSIALFDRKYSSGTFASRISDNEHPSPLLRDSEIRAVKHHPFK